MAEPIPLDPVVIREVQIGSINIAELTTVDLEGLGVFDQLMRTLRLHLDSQWDQERITGHEYASVYTQLYQATLNQAVEYLGWRTRLPYDIQNMENDANYKLAQIRIAEENLAKIPFEIEVLKEQAKSMVAGTTLVEVETTSARENLAKIPLELALLTGQGTKLGVETTLVGKQVEIAARNVDKLISETTLTERQIDVTLANAEQLAAQTDRLVKETALKLPIEVSNLTKQGEALSASTLLTTSQTVLSDLQADKVPHEIGYIQAQIANMSKQNLILEREFEIKLGQLALQAKQIELATIELDVQREEIQVKLAAIEAQKAQAALYAAKVVTEKAQTDATVIGPESVIDLNNQVLKAQTRGYQLDAENRFAKLMLDTFVTTYDNGDRTVNTINRLTDTDVGKVMTKMFNTLSIV